MLELIYELDVMNLVFLNTQIRRVLDTLKAYLIHNQT